MRKPVQSLQSQLIVQFCKQETLQCSWSSQTDVGKQLIDWRRRQGRREKRNLEVGRTPCEQPEVECMHERFILLVNRSQRAERAEKNKINSRLSFNENPL